METSFTPLASLAGGILIGISAIILMSLLGRVAGITGIVTGIFLQTPRKPKHGQEARPLMEWLWRFAMVIGMISTPFLYQMFFGQEVEILVPINKTMLIVGGLMVGVGVTLANGCTTGHGICGLARLSPRSLAAVLTFMGCAFLTVAIIRHVLAS